MTDPTGAGSRDPDALVARAGGGDRRRDQHFLVDDRVLDRLPGYLDADFGHVLEVGAGAGALTDRLLAVADRVTAVERDPELAGFLREEFAAAVGADRLDIVEGDVLEVDLPAFTACISNLPYGASSEIAFRLLPRGRPMLLTFQREFAERMAARPDTPEYGRLSVTSQQCATVEIVEVVPPEAFDPAPAVESAVVRLLPRDSVPDCGDEFFFDFVKAVFTQRRKTLRNAVRNSAHISGIEDPDAVVAAAPEGLMDRRPGELSPAEFADLAALAAEHA